MVAATEGDAVEAASMQAGEAAGARVLKEVEYQGMRSTGRTGIARIATTSTTGCVSSVGSAGHPQVQYRHNLRNNSRCNRSKRNRKYREEQEGREEDSGHPGNERCVTREMGDWPGSSRITIIISPYQITNTNNKSSTDKLTPNKFVFFFFALPRTPQLVQFVLLGRRRSLGYALTFFLLLRR